MFQDFHALFKQRNLLDKVADVLGLIRRYGHAGKRGRHQEEYASEEKHVDRQAESEKIREPKHPARKRRKLQQAPVRNLLRKRGKIRQTGSQPALYLY